jgi:hypothetical protein
MVLLAVPFRASLPRPLPKMNHELPLWICCQLGAREHYSVPRALYDRDALGFLFTDAWVQPGSLIGQFKRSLSERYHPQLASAPVASATGALLAFETMARVRRLSGWNLILARNRWFQRQAVRRLEDGRTEKGEGKWGEADGKGELADGNSAQVLFAYSYAAGDIFRWAKTRGWRTVLGQIDPGPLMGRVIRQLEQQNPEWGRVSTAPPESYWQNWRMECELADAILVNSEWSRDALLHEGMTASKIRVVPLAFDTPPGAAALSRAYPATFSRERPLRVLFLGQVNLLKGIAALAHAAERLKGEPVEFRVVGPVQVQIPEQFRRLSSLRLLGPVARGAAAEHFRQADVFCFRLFVTDSASLNWRRRLGGCHSSLPAFAGKWSSTAAMVLSWTPLLAKPLPPPF